MKTQRRISLAGWRDATLFLTGIGLIIHEAVIRVGPERPSFLLLFGGMVGLPAFLRADEKRNNSTPPSADAEASS